IVWSAGGTTSAARPAAKPATAPYSGPRTRASATTTSTTRSGRPSGSGMRLTIVTWRSRAVRTKARETSRRTAQPLPLGDGEDGEDGGDGEGDDGLGDGGGGGGRRLSRRRVRGCPTTTPTMSIAVKSTNGATMAVRSSCPGVGRTFVIRPIGTSATNGRLPMEANDTSRSPTFIVLELSRRVNVIG